MDSATEIQAWSMTPCDPTREQVDRFLGLTGIADPPIREDVLSVANPGSLVTNNSSNLVRSTGVL